MNSSQATGRASKLPDYGLPGNDLNPNTPTPDQQKKSRSLSKPTDCSA